MQKATTKGTKWVAAIAAVFGGLMLFGIVMQQINQEHDEQQEQQARKASAPCVKAAMVVTLDLAAEGYHVTAPKAFSAIPGTIAIGSTDMNEHTVEEFKSALLASPDMVRELRDAGCTHLCFYGNNLGTFGVDIDLKRDLP